MMNEGEALVLGRRAKRCARWRWCAGMLWWTEPSGAPDDGGDYGRKQDDYDRVPAGAIPDLEDRATQGCLLALVRDAWPTAPATTSRHGLWSKKRGHYHAWTCSYCTGSDWRQAHGETEAEALVAALEAAGARERGEE